jgi:hypothetical protein
VFQHRPKDAPSPRSAQASQSSTVDQDATNGV